MAGVTFDDLIPGGAAAPPPGVSFDDLVPRAPPAGTLPVMNPATGEVELQGDPGAKPDAATRFLATAGARAAGGIGDLFTQGPQAFIRSELFPDIARFEHAHTDASAPATDLAQALLDKGDLEYKPSGASDSAGLGAASGALAGAPGGPVGMLLGGVLGGLGPTSDYLSGGNRAVRLGVDALGLLAGKGAEKAWESVLPADQAAALRLGRRIDRDVQAGGPGIPEISSALDHEGTPPWLTRKPLAIADVGGPSVRGLAESVATVPGPGQSLAEQFLTDRQGGAGTRLLGDLREGIAQGPSAYATQQALETQQQAASAPLYAQAYKANQAMVHPDIDAVLSTPVGQQAWAWARDRMLNRMQRFGKPDPELTALAREQGITTGAGVAPGLNLRVLDLVKQGLNDIASQQRRGVINGTVRPGELGDTTFVTKQLVNALDEADATAPRDRSGNVTGPGLYAQARAAFAGPARSQDALELGQQIFKPSTFGDPQAISDHLAAMGPAEREMFKLGARQALSDGVLKTGDTGNPALAVAGNQMRRNLLRPLFPDDRVQPAAPPSLVDELYANDPAARAAFLDELPEGVQRGDVTPAPPPTSNAFDAFLDQINRERLMHGTYARGLGNSRTASRVANQAAEEGDGGMLGPLLQSGAAIAAHEPVASLPGFLRLGKKANEWWNRLTPEQNLALSRMLYSADPAQNAATLQAVQLRPGAPGYSLAGALAAAPVVQSPGALSGRP